MARYGLLSSKDVVPDIKYNPLLKHGGANAIDMVAGCQWDFWIFDINLVKGDLVKMHDGLCEFSYYTHDHAGYGICSINIQGCDKIKDDLQEMMNKGLIHIIKPREDYEEDVNMVFGGPGEFWTFDVKHMYDDLVQLHATFFLMDGQEEHHYGSCQIFQIWCNCMLHSATFPPL